MPMFRTTLGSFTAAGAAAKVKMPGIEGTLSVRSAVNVRSVVDSSAPHRRYDLRLRRLIPNTPIAPSDVSSRMQRHPL